MHSQICLLTLSLLSIFCNGQRVAPGVPPQHYQQAQPQYQVPQHGNMHQQVPQMQQVPIQQQQVPVQYQQQQVPAQFQQQQVPVQHVQGHGHGHHGEPQILNAANMAHEKDHIAEHLEMPLDTSKMSEQELQFHYFKLHDADNNNKLDGCELIKSLIHWHDQGKEKANAPTEDKIFKDEELTTLIDPILNVDDSNKDGYIDYPEFIKAQQKAAAQNNNV
ncbi:multiple coagulation factor deficiency protein 2 homolog [Coccinella septempunctata]|uniref:multiple coagulation factor deficiency protein 2 homolog n=1 Tax=Coccinella septempunctata TaxID=41139 RepID=UPI001D060AA8|nr:multiple coagulation factor deficiency protein 2 homolog [Coccinella septempunctata]